MTVVRFLLGPHHGHVMELQDPLQPQMHVPVMMPIEWASMMDDHVDLSASRIKHAVYELRKIVGGRDDGGAVYVCTVDPSK